MAFPTEKYIASEEGEHAGDDGSRPEIRRVRSAFLTFRSIFGY